MKSFLLTFLLLFAASFTSLEARGCHHHRPCYVAQPNVVYMAPAPVMQVVQPVYIVQQPAYVLAPRPCFPSFSFFFRFR